MKKKIYEQPKTEVVKIEHAEVICASTLNYNVDSPGFYEYDEEDL